MQGRGNEMDYLEVQVLDLKKRLLNSGHLDTFLRIDGYYFT
jgi:hypothetical protein